MDDLEKQAIMARVRGSDIEDAQRALIELTVDGCPESAWAEELCISCFTHHNEGIRGNAVLGLGHLARTEGLCSQQLAVAVVEAALRDTSRYVRGHAEAAADDIRQRHGWEISAPE